jgi:LDH2 family malate/lactate/ureidoglycolate dehydrogenase
MKIAGYELDLLVVGFPGKSVCHGGMPPARPDEPVLVHGDLEAQTRERRRAKGIPLPGTLAAKIRALCEEAQVPFLLT